MICIKAKFLYLTKLHADKNHSVYFSFKVEINKLKRYKKLAGTSAVFIDADCSLTMPVERDGMIWSADELGLVDCSISLNWKSPMANGLALEGLESYEPATNGDARFVNSIGVAFTYIEKIHGWVHLSEFH
jgi:hypothetical protein